MKREHFIVFPKILPDELLGGYRARVASWNDASTSKELAVEIDGAYPDLDGKDMTSAFIQVAAAANETTPARLMLDHSCRHVLIGLKEEERECFESDRARSVSWSYALYSPDQRVRCCPACIEEDKRTHKFAYWRRSHQIPGTYLCSIHGCPLEWSASMDLPPASPACASRQRVPFDTAQLAALASSRKTSTAVEFLNTLVQHQLVIRPRVMTDTLRNRLLLGDDSRTSTAALARQLNEAFPKCWLEYFAHGAAAIARSRVMHCLIHGRTPSYLTVALLSALTYPNAGKALADLKSTTHSEATPIRAEALLNDCVASTG